MKKVAYLGIVFALLLVLAVPAMAKSPNNNGNGNGGDHGNSANAGQNSSADVATADQGQGNQTNHSNHGNQGNHGNHGGKGNGNQGQTHPNTPFYLQGTITGIFSDTQTISVTLTHGNAMVKQFIGTNLTIKITDATQLFKITQGGGDESGAGETASPSFSSSESSSTTVSATNDEGDGNRVPITFGDLAVGQRVAIHGNLVEGVYTARLITVYIREPIGESVGEQP